MYIKQPVHSPSKNHFCLEKLFIAGSAPIMTLSRGRETRHSGWLMRCLFLVRLRLLAFSKQQKYRHSQLKLLFYAAFYIPVDFITQLLAQWTETDEPLGHYISAKTHRQRLNSPGRRQHSSVPTCSPCQQQQTRAE